MKASPSKGKNSMEESDNFDEESYKKEDIGLFAIHYNRHLKRNKLKNTNKRTSKFLKYLPT